MARVTVHNGTEGPAHDPYGYTEITFTRTDGRWIRYRSGGLGYVRLTMDNGGKYEAFDGRDDRPITCGTLETMFEAFTGMTSRTAEQLPAHLHARAYRRANKAQRALMDWADYYDDHGSRYA